MNILLENKRQENLINKSLEEKIEFFNIINEIISNDTVKKMKDYRQHCDTSCYEHCIHVAYYSYYIAKKLGLDYVSTARASMIHDLFLYDWRHSCKGKKFSDLHAFAHPRIALKNASKLFDLNPLEQDIILKHMWPVTIAFPKYRESYIVTFMDKYSALKESYLYMRSNLRSKKIYKYAYIFLSLIIFRIV